jgi:hypothetical protein
VKNDDVKIIPNLLLSLVRLDGGTQSRIAMNEETIEEYFEVYKEVPDKMRPIVVFLDTDKRYWLADGFHRIYAAQRASLTRVNAEIHKGSLRDAILYSLKANALHGLKRTNLDKRRAVEILLRDPEWGVRTDRWIGEAGGVSHNFVNRIRDDLRELGELAQMPMGLVGKDGRLWKDLESPAEDMDTATKRDSISRQPSLGSSGESVQMRESSAHESDGGEKGADDIRAVPDGVVGSSAPCVPPIDMLGVEASDEWIENVSAVRAELSKVDSHLRESQKILSPVLAGARNEEEARRYGRLMSQLADTLDVLDEATPEKMCRCQDPDGTAGRRSQCLACHDTGYLTVEQVRNVDDAFWKGAA